MSSHDRCTRTTHTIRRAAMALALAGIAAASTAHAGTSGSVAVTSDYLFRGVTQTNKKPALQGGVTWTADSGFYVGGWGSSISWLSDADPAVSSQVELDGFVGYSGKFGESDVGFDVGANYYWYPGSYPSGYNSANTLELYAGVTYKVLSAKYWHSTTDLFGIPDSDGSGNLDVAANWEFTPGWTLNAAVGKQWVNHYSALDYSFWKAGVTKSFESGFSIAASYNDTDIAGADDAFVVTFSKSF
ncbi:MAG: TorF family putative porin [Thermomonas sp.]|uniref:TorF family putative porin n=1 Tax=Thermomonas sp. TaxID=1971895 RepID=UPI0039E4F835